MDNLVNQSKLEANACSRHVARENVRKRIAIGLGFTPDWPRSGASFLNQSQSVFLKYKTNYSLLNFPSYQLWPISDLPSWRKNARASATGNVPAQWRYHDYGGRFATGIPRCAANSGATQARRRGSVTCVLIKRRRGNMQGL